MMAILSAPQVFNERVSPPFDIHTFDKVYGSFYIPDCQDLTQIRKINELAALFSQPNFSKCLRRDGGISKEQVESYFVSYNGPELNEIGRFKVYPFDGLHVITADKVDRLKGAIACPVCGEIVRTLITCPLMELKLRYPDSDIEWSEVSSLPLPHERSLPVSRSRALSVGRDFLTIHLAFLIDFAYHGLSPSDTVPSEGIITKFFKLDPDYATLVLDSLTYEHNKKKADLWLRQLLERHDLDQMRQGLYEYLSSLSLSAYQRPGVTTQTILDSYQGIYRLEKLRDELDVTASPATPRPPSPIRDYHVTPQSEERCSPIRSFLLILIVSFTFLYFLWTILSSFFKGRFLFGEDI